MTRTDKASAKNAREKPVNPPGFLATQDLKERGWTPALIARFLGEHDGTRPNGLRMGRRRLPPVKLYAEARVHEAERQDSFLAAQARAADARERAERTRASRGEKRERQLEAAALAFVPAIHPEPLRKGATRLARDPYLGTLSEEFDRISAEVGRLSAAEADTLEALLRAQLDRALHAAYPWYPSPDRGAVTSGLEARSQTAQPSDWREWDWD